MKKSFSQVSKWVGAGIVAFSPALAFADTANVDGLFNLAFNILNKLIPLFIAIAVVIFLYGVLTYVLAGGDEEKRAAGRQTIIYGIIAIFVMVSVYGLVNLLVNSISLDNRGLTAPSVGQIRPAYGPGF